MKKIYLSPSTQPRNIYFDRVHNEEQVCNWVTDELVKELDKYEVEIIRGAINVPTTDRIAQANQLKVDYYLAIHTNAGGGRGCETFYQDGNQVSSAIRALSKKYATILNNDIAVITTTNTTMGDRGVKVKKQLNGTDWNHELRGVQYPTNLVEYEFHDTQAGSAWILSNIKLIGITTAQSIVKMFGLKLKQVSIPQPNQDVYTVVRGDVLSRIASRFGFTTNDLYELNKDVIGSNPNLIEVGMMLRLKPNIVFVPKYVETVKKVIKEVEVIKTVEVEKPININTTIEGISISIQKPIK